MKDYTEDELKKFAPLEVDGVSPNTYEINMSEEIKNKRFDKIIKGTIIPDVTPKLEEENKKCD